MTFPHPWLNVRCPETQSTNIPASKTFSMVPHPFANSALSYNYQWPPELCVMPIISTILSQSYIYYLTSTVAPISIVLSSSTLVLILLSLSSHARHPRLPPVLFAFTIVAGITMNISCMCYSCVLNFDYLWINQLICQATSFTTRLGYS